MPANNVIDTYIAKYSGETRSRLVEIKTLLEEIMPTAEQKISYGMPTFKLGKTNAFHFAAFKNHVSIFPSTQPIVHFAKQLEPYKTSKGTIQFQNNEPLPLELIRKIAVWRKKELEQSL